MLKCAYVDIFVYNIPSIPKDEQVLFHSEAFGSQEAAAAFRQAATSTRPLLRVAVQLRELHQLVVFKGVVVARLLSHPRSVNDQRLLRMLGERTRVMTASEQRVSDLFVTV